jgi:hypothetical protein
MLGEADNKQKVELDMLEMMQRIMNVIECGALLPWGQWEVELQLRINGGTCAAGFRGDGSWYCCEGVRRRGAVPCAVEDWKERFREQQWSDEMEEVVCAWEIQFRVRWEGNAR